MVFDFLKWNWKRKSNIKWRVYVRNTEKRSGIVFKPSDRSERTKRIRICRRHSEDALGDEYLGYLYRKGFKKAVQITKKYKKQTEREDHDFRKMVNKKLVAKLISEGHIRWPKRREPPEDSILDPATIKTKCRKKKWKRNLLQKLPASVERIDGFHSSYNYWREQGKNKNRNRDYDSGVGSEASSSIGDSMYDEESEEEDDDETGLGAATNSLASNGNYDDDNGLDMGIENANQVSRRSRGAHGHGSTSGSEPSNAVSALRRSWGMDSSSDGSGSENGSYDSSWQSQNSQIARSSASSHRGHKGSMHIPPFRGNHGSQTSGSRSRVSYGSQTPGGYSRASRGSQISRAHARRQTQSDIGYQRSASGSSSGHKPRKFRAEVDPSESISMVGNPYVYRPSHEEAKRRKLSAKDQNRIIALKWMDQDRTQPAFSKFLKDKESAYNASKHSSGKRNNLDARSSFSSSSGSRASSRPPSVFSAAPSTASSASSVSSHPPPPRKVHAEKHHQQQPMRHNIRSLK